MTTDVTTCEVPGVRFAAVASVLEFATLEAHFLAPHAFTPSLSYGPATDNRLNVSGTLQQGLRYYGFLSGHSSLTLS